MNIKVCELFETTHRHVIEPLYFHESMPCKNILNLMIHKYDLGEIDCLREWNKDFPSLSCVFKSKKYLLIGTEVLNEN